VLSLQGAVAEHEAVLASVGVEAVQVRLPEHLGDLAGLILPGGESTTMRKLIERALPGLAVMSFGEVAREIEVDAMGMVEVEYAAA